MFVEMWVIAIAIIIFAIMIWLIRYDRDTLKVNKAFTEQLYEVCKKDHDKITELEKKISGGSQD